MKRVTNRGAVNAIAAKQTFRNNTRTGTFYGEWVNKGGPTVRYCVYSYGEHWPIAVYEHLLNAPSDGVWYMNNETPCSGTTSRHTNLTRKGMGYDTPYVPLEPEDMKKVIEGGSGMLAVMRGQ